MEAATASDPSHDRASSNTALAIRTEQQQQRRRARHSTFDGEPVGDTDVLIKYTFYGDTNLDGLVNAADYTALDNGFNTQSGPTPLTGWRNGDFNYDGVINGDDYTLIDNPWQHPGLDKLRIHRRFGRPQPK